MKRIPSEVLQWCLAATTAASSLFPVDGLADPRGKRASALPQLRAIPVPRSNWADAFTRDYRIAHYLTKAIELQALSPTQRAARLRELARDRKRGEEVFPLCRMLFEAKVGTFFRGPNLGLPDFVDDRPEDFLSERPDAAKTWPLAPIAVVDGIPILIVSGYLIGGLAEGPQGYVEYCLEKCRWTERQYAPADQAKAARIVEKFIRSNPRVAGYADFLRRQAF